VSPTLILEELVLLLVGACSVTFLALGNTTLQLASDPAMRGRVMSLWSVAFLGSTPVGGPIVGLVGSSLGARYALGLGAIAALAAAAFGWGALRGRAIRSEGPLAPPAVNPDLPAAAAVGE
jgi:MFS family permease